jgi:hypothetical protein
MFRRVGLGAVAVVLAASATACDIRIGSEHTDQRCTPPSLRVEGSAPHPGSAVVVRPGETLRLHGRDYTDDCAGGGTGTSHTITKVQLVLQSQARVAPIAEVHPRGLDSAFTVSVTIPPTTRPGPAEIFDVLAPPHGVIRLVVRR